MSDRLYWDEPLCVAAMASRNVLNAQLAHMQIIYSGGSARTQHLVTCQMHLMRCTIHWLRLSSPIHRQIS